MDFPVDFVLLRYGEGVIEYADTDIFAEDYVRKVYGHPGKYAVMQRKDLGDYRTTRRLRSFELVAYAAPKDDEGLSSTPPGSLIDDKIEEFEKKRAAGWPERKPKDPVVPMPPSPPSPSFGDGWRIVRKDGSQELKVVDSTGASVLDGFSFDDLKNAKQHFSGSPQVVKKDLNDQSFIKFVVVFLGGLLVGALGTFVVMNQKHQQELASLHGKLDAMQQQFQQRMASPKGDFNSWLLSEYNKGGEGPV